MLVAEMQLDKTKAPSCLAISFSVAGRESVLTLHWPLDNSRIDTRVLEDLQATVSRQLAQSIELMLGIQGVLPMV
jgi:hypothetical protein